MKIKIMQCAVALLVMGSTAWAQASVGDVYIDPAAMDDETLTPGTFIQIAVNADDCIQVSTMALSVAFDPTVLQFIGGQLGTFFQNQTPLTITNGETSPGLYELVAAIGGGFTSGDFSLVILNFMVLDVGTTNLILGDGPGGGANPAWPSFVGQGFAIIDPASVTDGTFSNEPAGGTSGGGGTTGGGGGTPPPGGGGGDSGGGGCSAASGSNGLPLLLLLLPMFLLIKK